MKNVIATMFNYDRGRGEINTAPSVTVPDQTLSLREILERHARGLPLEGSGKEPIYHGEDYMPNLATLDLSELENLKINVTNEIASARAAAQEQKNASDKKAYDDAIQKLVDEKIAAAQAANGDIK